MATVDDTAQLLDLKNRMRALSPADKLRMCGELLDRGPQFRDIVETLAGEVVDGLRALRLFENKGRRR